MKLIIIGSGNWGTTLAQIFAPRNNVYLWTIDDQEADEINKNRENRSFLPGVELDRNIIVEKKFSHKVMSDDVIIIAIPSRKIEELADEFVESDINKCIVVNASKGVEHSTLRTISETFCKKLPEIKFATLSGPTIAKEIAQGLPAKAILASKNISILFKLQEILRNDYLKFDFNQDVKGVELAASLKGLIAIAVGIADGLGLQTNIFGVIMTYGLHEYKTVMEFLGVSTKTAYSIAGMGDLITTCISENSRNRKFGKLLAKGYSRDEALAKVGMVVEGVSMAKTVNKLTKFNLSIPLIACITHIIFDDVSNIKDELLCTINSISE